MDFPRFVPFERPLLLQADASNPLPFGAAGSIIGASNSPGAPVCYVTCPVTCGHYKNAKASNTHACGCSSMVEQELPKLLTWVRFPSPAPNSSIALTLCPRGDGMRTHAVRQIGRIADLDRFSDPSVARARTREGPSHSHHPLQISR